MKKLIPNLLIFLSLNAWSQEPLADTSFFLSKEYFSSLSLKLNESNKKLKVYISKMLIQTSREW